MMQIRLKPEYRGKMIAFFIVAVVVAIVLLMNGYSGVSEPGFDLKGSYHFDQSGGNIMHGIIFDAGSTGSRIHVIKLRKDGETCKIELPYDAPVRPVFLPAPLLWGHGGV